MLVTRRATLPKAVTGDYSRLVHVTYDNQCNFKALWFPQMALRPIYVYWTCDRLGWMVQRWSEYSKKPWSFAIKTLVLEIKVRSNLVVFAWEPQLWPHEAFWKMGLIWSQSSFTKVRYTWFKERWCSTRSYLYLGIQIAAKVDQKGGKPATTTKEFYARLGADEEYKQEVDGLRSAVVAFASKLPTAGAPDV